MTKENRLKITIEGAEGGPHIFECDAFIGGCVDYVDDSLPENPTDLFVDVLTANIDYISGCRAITTISSSLYDQCIKPLVEGDNNG